MAAYYIPWIHELGYSGTIADPEVADIVASSTDGMGAAADELVPLADVAADMSEVALEELVMADWALFAEYAAEILLAVLFDTA